MDAVEFLKQSNRICKTYIYDRCTECPAYKCRCGDQFEWTRRRWRFCCRAMGKSTSCKNEAE